MATRRTDPSYRILEQNADTNQRRLTRQTNPPGIRAQENERNAQQNADTNWKRLTRQTNPLATRRTTNQAYRIEKNEQNATSMATRHTDPSYRISEQTLILIKEDWQDKLILQR